LGGTAMPSASSASRLRSAARRAGSGARIIFLVSRLFKL
jgi:hypothetical protein